MPNFDANITGMLFGKGRTHFGLFKGGFLANFDDKVDFPEHPLVKVLFEFKDGWCIGRGSTMCFYDSKFKQPGASQYSMRWNFPPEMTAKFQELKERAKQPEEQITAAEDHVWKYLT
ncbi:hypothetical protein DFH09DRAFT_1327821 [Mycena vulgaris]|nr:hypothetical protein DFH09DRAFT_1327821 [Mycena vulgaris]